MGALEPHRGDFYAYETLLADDEQKEILRLREFLEREVRPIADEYWAEAEFPRHLIAPLRDLDIVGGAYEGFRDPPFSRLFSGFTSLELSRVDPSFGTFFGVHAGLAFGSIYHCGSPEQRDRWLPGMADLTSIGAFALTEPEHGRTSPAASRPPPSATATTGCSTGRSGGSATGRLPLVMPRVVSCSWFVYNSVCKCTDAITLSPRR